MRNRAIGCVVAAVLTLSPGCAVRTGRVRFVPRCADGLPPEILTDPACPPDGVCGYSCLPNRWRLDGEKTNGDH